MWSKSNADKLKMELSGKREKQQQSVKNEKIMEDNRKMDSGFLSDANLSCDMLSKENIEYDMKNDEHFETNPKVSTQTALDSGLDIGESDYFSELDVDQKEICEPLSKNENFGKFYFQQNEDGDTYVPIYIYYNRYSYKYLL